MSGKGEEVAAPGLQLQLRSSDTAAANKQRSSVWFTARASTKVSLLILENHDFYKDNPLKKRIATPIKTSERVHSYGVCPDTI